ncbi:hypothetical protein GJ496_003065 [Pomphorhynchus laevis]|nr:hypothetical protein GJ496_003065 [Pomphorhynchus laevis]
MSNSERTFIMLKPDGVQRYLVGQIIQRFERKGFKLVAMKMLKPSCELLKEHYKEHVGKWFFEQFVSYVASGPVVAMVWEGTNIIATARKMLGATNPANADPGTIRGGFAVETGRSIIHGSDGPESSKREIQLWFKSDEITNWAHSDNCWIVE